MCDEDWPDPLPEGWILKKFSNGKVWAHNKKTGQTFHTKKDLLRYVQYAETILPLFGNKTIPLRSKGNSSKASDDGEGNSEQSSDGEDGSSEEACDDNDDSLYGGIDFSKGIWSVEVEMIERSNPRLKGKTEVQDDQQLKGKTKVEDDQKRKGKMKVEDDQKLNRKMKVQDDQQLKGKTKIQDDQQPKMKMEMESATELRIYKRAGPRKKFEMPPKRFRGWTKNHPKP